MENYFCTGWKISVWPPEITLKPRVICMIDECHVFVQQVLEIVSVGIYVMFENRILYIIAFCIEIKSNVDDSSNLKGK